MKCCGTCYFINRISEIFKEPIIFECQITKERTTRNTKGCKLHSGYTKKGYDLVKNNL